MGPVGIREASCSHPMSRHPMTGHIRVRLASAAGAAGAAGAPSVVEETTTTVTTADENALEPVWLVVVWNDPVNLMTYVTYVLQKLFGFSVDKATALMLDVHHKGRAVVRSGPRQRSEDDVARLHGCGLRATLEQAG